MNESIFNILRKRTGGVNVEFHLGVIGAGNMGSAIIKGALRQGVLSADDISISDPQAEKLLEWKTLGTHVYTENLSVVQAADLLLLAVKPQVIEDVLDQISGHVGGKCVISIVAGISKKYLMERLPGAYLVCVMPNTPLLLGVGACAITPREDVPEKWYQAAVSLFSAAGEVAEVPAELMNEIIPVNGSSPAFFFRMAEAMVESAKRRGIDETVALHLAAQTMAGAAEMLLHSGKSAAELTRQVCSPGGTTLAALTAFDELGYDSVIEEAFERCIKRAYELGR